MFINQERPFLVISELVSVIGLNTPSGY